MYKRLKGTEGTAPSTITVYLNARDARCPSCYDYLRGLGLAFTGRLPGLQGGDCVVLQRLSEDTFNKEGVLAEPNYARMLEQLYQINDW